MGWCRNGIWGGILRGLQCPPLHPVFQAVSRHWRYCQPKIRHNRWVQEEANCQSWWKIRYLECGLCVAFFGSSYIEHFVCRLCVANFGSRLLFFTFCAVCPFLTQKLRKISRFLKQQLNNELLIFSVRFKLQNTKANHCVYVTASTLKTKFDRSWISPFLNF